MKRQLIGVSLIAVAGFLCGAAWLVPWSSSQQCAEGLTSYPVSGKSVCVTQANTSFLACLAGKGAVVTDAHTFERDLTVDTAAESLGVKLIAENRGTGATTSSPQSEAATQAIIDACKRLLPEAELRGAMSPPVDAIAMPLPPPQQEARSAEATVADQHSRGEAIASPSISNSSGTVSVRYENIVVKRSP